MIKYKILTNGTNWCYSCWKATIDNDRITFVNNIVPVEANVIVKKIAFWHYRFHRPFFKKLPFLSIWHSNIENSLEIDDSCDFVLIIYDWNYISKDFELINRLRRHHKRLKIVYLFSNIVSVTGAKVYGILDKLNSVYDAVYAFDRIDSEKYGFFHSPLIYTTNERLPNYSNELEYDLFYLGRAKDRYNQLLKVYEKAKSEGLKCKFTIVGVPHKMRLYEDEINYNAIPYSQAIEDMGRSKCIVDMIQGDSTALTIKTCEAVLLGRKLITSNYRVADEPFYHRENIHVFSEENSIKYFINLHFIDYTEKDKYYFSPDALFEKIYLNCFR